MVLMQSCQIGFQKQREFNIACFKCDILDQIVQYNCCSDSMISWRKVCREQISYFQYGHFTIERLGFVVKN